MGIDAPHSPSLAPFVLGCLLGLGWVGVVGIWLVWRQITRRGR